MGVNSGRLAGRVAIVTGAGHGIGRAAALGFARAGAAVVVNDIDGEAVERTARDVRESGGRAALCVRSVGDEEAGEALVDAAMDSFGGLHILLNVAGILIRSPIQDMTSEEFDRVVRVHLYGTFHNIRAAARRVMISQEYGKIINLTSRAGLRGYPNLSGYAAANMGIVGLSTSLANELMPYHINVNAVAPQAWSRSAASRPPEEQARAKRKRSENVLGRVGLNEDLIPLFLFLASEESDYLTGQVIHATGQPVHMT